MAEAKSIEGSILAGRIAEIPADLSIIIRNGFAVASTIPEDKRREAIQLIVRQIERAGGSVDTDVVTAATGLIRRDASRLNAALSTTVGLLTETTASASDFVTAGQGKIFEDAHAATALAVANHIVSQRAELQRSMAHENLANRVLPSLTSFDIAVDLRFAFKDHRVEDSVAVAVVHIGTDARSQHLWLQLSRHDVQRIVGKLTETLKQMELVEDITTQRENEARG